MKKFNYPTLLSFLVIVLISTSCTKENINHLAPIDAVQHNAPLVSNEGPGSVPTRVLEAVTTENVETGEVTKSIQCIHPGKNCDVGSMVAEPKENINYDLLNERESVLLSIDHSSKEELKHLFLYANYKSLFPFLYQEDIYRGIENGDLSLSYEAGILMVKDDLSEEVLFAYKID